MEKSKKNWKLTIFKSTTKTAPCRKHDVGGRVSYIIYFVFYTWERLTLSQSLTIWRLTATILVVPHS